MSVEVSCFVFELSRTPNQAISGTKPGTKFFNVVSLVSNEKISRAQAFAHRLRAPQDVEQWPQMPKVWLCTCSSQRATLLVWIWHNERDKIMECDTSGSQHTGESPLCWAERRLHSFSTCASFIHSTFTATWIRTSGFLIDKVNTSIGVIFKKAAHLSSLEHFLLLQHVFFFFLSTVVYSLYLFLYFLTNQYCNG